MYKAVYDTVSRHAFCDQQGNQMISQHYGSLEQAIRPINKARKRECLKAKIIVVRAGPDEGRSRKPDPRGDLGEFTNAVLARL